MIKRIFDLGLVIISFVLLFIPFIAVTIAVKITSPGPILYWSQRVGRNNQLFLMPKFRSMKYNAPVVATHLLHNPDDWLTPIGSFLRKTSLDELPQLWCIIKGEMSFVGPRPALFNQDDLIHLRTNAGVDQLIPGLTGWAQINGRDELPVQNKVDFDIEYLKKKSFLFDLFILWVTAKKVFFKEGIIH